MKRDATCRLSRRDALALTGAGLFVFFRLQPEPLDPVIPTDPNAYFKCSDASCGHVVQGPMGNLVKSRQISAEWMKNPQGRGGRCAKCRRDTLEMARKCRKCQEVFPAHLELCPACGTSPFHD